MTCRNGQFVYINQAFVNLFGVTSRDVKGRGLSLLFHDLTDDYTKQQFPSPDSSYVSENHLVELGMTDGEESDIENQKKNHRNKEAKNVKKGNEFTAVLYDSALKTITCKVAIVPTVFSSGPFNRRKNDGVHFAVCIQKLFIEEMFGIRSSQQSRSESIMNSQVRNRHGLTAGNNRRESTQFDPIKPFMEPFFSPEFFPERIVVIEEETVVPETILVSHD